MNASAYGLRKPTGNIVSWHHRNPELSNACCLYCGQLVTGPDAVQSDKEHLIARNFGPLGSMDGHQFNFIFRACRACNARKAAAERHVSSVTLFNSPGRATDSRANAAAERKGNSDFHPGKRGVRIQDAGEELKIEMQRGDMSMSFGMSAPPRLDRSDAGEVCFSHIQGLFSLITTTDYRDPEQIRLLPQDQFIWYDMYTHQDWGNPQAVGLAHRVRDWECLANIESADGYFKATMRCSEAGWFWALEWNKQLRLVGGIGQGPMQVFEHLPSEEWMPTPRGRMRREVPLDPATDILFAGVVQPT